MAADNTALGSYLERLGFDPQIADLYQALRLYGPQTISELARNSGVERIRIYRLLDELKRSALVELEIQYKRTILHAAPFTTTQTLLAKREQELKDLQRDYGILANSLITQTTQFASTKVQFYEGTDGIKQMLWNQTKTKGGENLSILYDNMQSKTNLAFFERWVHSCNEQNIQFRGIIADHFVHTQQAWYAKHTNERLKHWESRRIDDEDFSISYSIVTYDDVVLYYDWNDKRIFGIEIHNPAIAQMQRQFFELLWQKAVPVDDVKG